MEGEMGFTCIACLIILPTNRNILILTFIKPLSTAYTQAVNSWLRLHTGRVITLAQVPLLFNEVFILTAAAKTAINESRKMWNASTRQEYL